MSHYGSAPFVFLSGHQCQPRHRSFESLHAEISSNSRSVRLVVLYRPDSKDNRGHRSPFGVFLDEFNIMVEHYSLHPSGVIYVGDFNIWVDDNLNSDNKSFQTLLSSHGLQQHISEPTHRHGHILDLIITRGNEGLMTNFSVRPGLSDHFAICGRLMLEKPPLAQKIVNTRRLRNIDTNAFSLDIIMSLSALNADDEDVDTLVQNYELVMRKLLDKHAPVKSRKITIRPNTQWYNSNIHDAKCERRRLERKWRRSKLDIDCNIYKQHQHLVKKLIENAKNQF